MSKKKKEDKKSKLQKLAKKSVTNKSGLHYATKYTAPKRSYSVDSRNFIGNPRYGFTIESARQLAQTAGKDQFNFKETYRSPAIKYWTKKKGQFGSRQTIHKVL